MVQSDAAVPNPRLLTSALIHTCRYINLGVHLSVNERPSEAIAICKDFDPPFTQNPHL